MDDTDRRTELDAIKITTRSELHRMWELLMSPLGFSSPTLWVTFVGPDHRPTRFLLEIGEMPETPTEEDAHNLLEVLEQLLRDEGEGSSVAFLVARPGRGGLTDADRSLARLLLAESRRAGVRIEPMHVANDVSVMAVAPDDLAA